MLDTNSIIAKTPVIPVAEVAASATPEKVSPDDVKQRINTHYSGQIKKEDNRENVQKNNEKIIDELNKDLSVFNTRVAFSIDEKTNKTVIKIIDNSNNDVIKQLPPEYLLKVSQRITELIGLIVDKKA